MRMWRPPAPHPRSRNFMQLSCILWSRDLISYHRTASEGGYAPTLFTQCWIQTYGTPLPRRWVNKGKKEDRSVAAPILLSVPGYRLGGGSTSVSYLCTICAILSTSGGITMLLPASLAQGRSERLLQPLLPIDRRRSRGHPSVCRTISRSAAPASGYSSGGPRCSMPTLAAAAFSFSMSGSAGGGKVRSRAGSPASATKRSKPAGMLITRERSVSSPSTA